MVWKNVNCFNPTVWVTGGGGCSLLLLLLNVWLYVVLGLAALPVPVGPEPWRFVRPHGHQHEAVDGHSGRDQVCTWIATFHCNVHVGFSSSSNDRIRNAKSKIWKTAGTLFFLRGFHQLLCCWLWGTIRADLPAVEIWCCWHLKLQKLKSVLYFCMWHLLSTISPHVLFLFLVLHPAKFYVYWSGLLFSRKAVLLLSIRDC